MEEKQLYEWEWGASREIKSPDGYGFIDNEGNFINSIDRVGANGSYVFEMLKGVKANNATRMKILKAINSAMWGLELDDFLYNDKQRNKFLNSILKDVVIIHKFSVETCFIVREKEFIYSYPKAFYKRNLIKDGKKLEDVEDECKNFVYASKKPIKRPKKIK